MAISVKHYSLLDYSLIITATDAETNRDFGRVEIGGPQSYFSGATVTKNEDNISQITDATGSTAYSFSNNHSGTIEIELSFVAEALDNLIKYVRESYNITKDASWDKWKRATFTIDIFRAGNTTGTIISCMGCMLRKNPEWGIGAEVGTRKYEFLSAKVEEYTISERGPSGS